MRNRSQEQTLFIDLLENLRLIHLQRRCSGNLRRHRVIETRRPRTKQSGPPDPKALLGALREV